MKGDHAPLRRDCAIGSDATMKRTACAKPSFVVGSDFLVRSFAMLTSPVRDIRVCTEKE